MYTGKKRRDERLEKNRRLWAEFGSKVVELYERLDKLEEKLK